MSDRQRDPHSRSDDAFALLAVILGVALAYEGRQIHIELAAGIALGLGGALLAVRGGRPIEGRGWLWCALLLGAGGLIACAVLELYQEWSAGQWLSQGSQASAPGAIYDIARTLSLLRIGGLAGSLAFLLGSGVQRLGSKREPDSEPESESKKSESGK